MSKKVPLIRVPQWLQSWNMAEWSADDDLPEPPREFFVGSVSLSLLRSLSGVSRRQIEERAAGSASPGYQRGHEPERSSKIARYIKYGYPLSVEKSLAANDHRELIHPGWLPTSILVNVLRPQDKRRRYGQDLELKADRALSIEGHDGTYYLNVPDYTDADGQLEPLEIIDGQHRIFSVDDLDGLDDSYEVPVVFFHGLSQSWQAYLFWVINVEPKKINPSLAFDLYPELRSQSWLERGEGIRIYREHRAQEITEAMWRHPRSPWRRRIELLGNRIDGHVSNAAFIRTLMATFVRRWIPNRIGGLFGSVDRDGKERVLRWNRTQQIAFLITAWECVQNAVTDSKANWAQACRESYQNLSEPMKEKINPDGLDPAFAGPYTLLGTDQGVRAISAVFNAFSVLSWAELGFERWEDESFSDEPPTDDRITHALESLRQQRDIVDFLQALAHASIDEGFDWRTSSEPHLREGDSKAQLTQAAYRGSSGYKALQNGVVLILTKSSDQKIAEVAQKVGAILDII